jgi:cell wall-associated NlpC family hydrolase
VSNHIPGRHRAPARLNPALSLSRTISRSAKPAAKASAVIAVSGGLVASFAFPASAAAPATYVRNTVPAATRAITAPSAAQTPLVPPSFGKIGFSGVAKPVPAAAPVDVSPGSTQTAPDAAPAPRSGGVLGIAGSLAGISYVYGGTTPAGFDCSGFTQYVFGRAGTSLPRTADAQRQATTRVSNPQPGDLVFIGSPAYHVGIYAGNGMMWDSPRTGKAVSRRSIWSSSATYGRV